MKFLLNIYEWLQKNIRPPSAFSWQTLILLSLFSGYMGTLATSFVQNLLFNFGWIFLIFGVYWATTSTGLLRIGFKPKEKKLGFPLSPWIAGAIVSVYLFSSRTGEIRPETIIYWPTISAVIAAIPDFLGDRFKLKKPPLQQRQNLVILFGTQLLISCWFQFYFVIQDWIRDYPTLLADDFRKSAFVVKWESPLPATPRGAEILDSMVPKLTQQLNNKPWPEIERALLPDARKNWLKTIAAQTKKGLPSLEENPLWKVDSKVSSKGSGYNLALQAIWQGPRSRPEKKYALTMSCQITPVYPKGSPATKPLNTPQKTPTPRSSIKCNPVKGWGIDEPTNTNDTSVKT